MDTECIAKETKPTKFKITNTNWSGKIVVGTEL